MVQSPLIYCKVLYKNDIQASKYKFIIAICAVDFLKMIQLKILFIYFL